MSIGKNSLARAVSASSGAVQNPAEVFQPEASSLVRVSPDRLRPLSADAVPAASKALIDSVRRHGILVPLLAARVGEEYLVLLGEHRLAASKALELPEVPVCVMDAADEKEAFRLMQEVRGTCAPDRGEIQNGKFYAAASLPGDMPVFLL